MSPDQLDRALILGVVLFGIATMVLTARLVWYRRILHRYQQAFTERGEVIYNMSRTREKDQRTINKWRARAEAAEAQLVEDDEIDEAIESIEKSIRGES